MNRTVLHQWYSASYSQCPAHPVPFQELDLEVLVSECRIIQGSSTIRSIQDEWQTDGSCPLCPGGVALHLEMNIEGVVSYNGFIFVSITIYF